MITAFGSENGRGTQARVGQDGGSERRRGAFAMRSRNADAAATLHQRAEHLRVTQFGNPPSAGGLPLGILGWDRRTVDQQVSRVRNIFGEMFLMKEQSAPLPALQRCRKRLVIGSAHRPAEAAQQFRKPAHSRPGDADQMRR